MAAQLKYSIPLADLLKASIRRNPERILTNSLITNTSLRVTFIFKILAIKSFSKCFPNIVGSYSFSNAKHLNFPVTCIDHEDLSYITLICQMLHSYWLQIFLEYFYS